MVRYVIYIVEKPTLCNTQKLQPITLVQVGGCRVPSSEASARTMKRRTENIGKVRSITSGGDNSAQLASEIKALSKAEREELLLEAQLPVVIPMDQALAMKADLGIPWNKFRVLRRYGISGLALLLRIP